MSVYYCTCGDCTWCERHEDNCPNPWCSRCREIDNERRRAA